MGLLGFMGLSLSTNYTPTEAHWAVNIILGTHQALFLCPSSRNQVAKTPHSFPKGQAPPK